VNARTSINTGVVRFLIRRINSTPEPTLARDRHYMQ
jgi:hypothetical protein